MAHCRGPVREAGVVRNIPLCSRQHSPLHKTPKPGNAADEPLRGVNLFQEVTGEALDDGLHVGGTALHELHHLQHQRYSVLAWLVDTGPSVGL